MIIQCLLSYLIILGTIIPISLYVSIEFIKFFQSMFIEFDALLYSNKVGPKCMSLILHEDLSKINVIFCDKTGTLTKNELKLKVVLIGNTLYNAKGENISDFKSRNDSNLHRDYIALFHSKENNNQLDHEIMKKHFFECLCLCNNSFSLTKENRLINPSTDEEALIKKINNFQVSILSKNSHEAIIKYNQEINKFEILAYIEFTSLRRAMSVIVKNELNEIFLFIKGADEVILDMIDKEDIRVDMNNAIHKISDFAVI